MESHVVSSTKCWCSQELYRVPVLASKYQYHWPPSTPSSTGKHAQGDTKAFAGKAQNTYKRRPLSSSNLPMTSRQATKEASAQTMPTKEEARHPRSSKGKGGQRRMAKSQQAASRQQPHILFMGQALTIQLSARVCSW